MYLENVVQDTPDPRAVGRFWAAALGATVLTDEADAVEARLELGPAGYLDLCFPRVTEPSRSPARLHLDLLGGTGQREVTDRLLGLGARHVDIGQGDVPWTVLADPAGEPFCVMEAREAYRDTGPIAALPLDSADPERDAVFWSALTGWVPITGTPGITSLRHPAGVGPLLELCPEPTAKQGKNRLHLDVRAERSDGDPVAQVRALGARLLEDPALPWTVWADPSGNEFCVLDAP